MDKTKKIFLFSIILLGFVVLIMSIYFFVIKDSDSNPKENVQIANPASTNCINLGGELEIRTDENGGQYGVCMKNEKECEEWALFRGECEL